MLAPSYCVIRTNEVQSQRHYQRVIVNQTLGDKTQEARRTYLVNDLPKDNQYSYYSIGRKDKDGFAEEYLPLVDVLNAAGIAVLPFSPVTHDLQIRQALKYLNQLNHQDKINIVTDSVRQGRMKSLVHKVTI